MSSSSLNGKILVSFMVNSHHFKYNTIVILRKGEKKFTLFGERISEKPHQMFPDCFRTLGGAKEAAESVVENSAYPFLKKGDEKPKWGPFIRPYKYWRLYKHVIGK